jgi:pimeloyl-ACP methyl ester carboxylesterase
MRTAPRGDGAPVLVLPGLLASDLSTRPLRAQLRSLGHHVHGLALGRNIGPTHKVERRLRELADELLERHGQPFTVLGWSLGGIYARAMAAERPDAVRMVITLGTPFAMTEQSQTRAHRTYERYAHLHVPGYALPIPDDVRGTAARPRHVIWSEQDGIVSWTASLETPSPTAENIGVRAATSARSPPGGAGGRRRPAGPARARLATVLATASSAQAVRTGPRSRPLTG